MELTLYHGTDVIFKEFDTRYSRLTGGALGYFGNLKTAEIFGKYINKYRLKFSHRYKFKECLGYNEETYKMLVDIAECNHEFDIVKIPIALCQPFDDFIFDNVMSIIALGESRLQECLYYHKIKKYPKEFIDAYDEFNDNTKFIEDDLYEVIIFNKELVDNLEFIGRV